MAWGGLSRLPMPRSRRLWWGCSATWSAAHLLHNAPMTVGDTVLPLAVAGGGLIVGGVLGGWVVKHRHRLA
jgi:hypothetical protein